MCSTSRMGQILLVDVGHPMKSSTVNKISESLTNVLSLASCIRGNTRFPIFGIAALDDNLHVIQPFDLIVGNYSLMLENVETIQDKVNIGIKLSLKDYKKLLEESILKILNSFKSDIHQLKLKMKLNQEFKVDFDSKLWWGGESSIRVQTTLLTAKAAHPIFEMIKSSVELCARTRFDKVHVVEIDQNNCFRFRKLRTNSSMISCTVISESVHNLENVFKESILEHERREQVNIVLEKELDIEVKCEIQDSIINPRNLLLPQIFMFPGTLMSKNFTVNKETSIRRLDILGKFNVFDFRSVRSFGVCHKILPTESGNLPENEFEMNEQLYDSLMRELHQNEYGLLGRIKSSDIAPFYIITSDGDKLMIDGVAPIELQLPQHPEMQVPRSEEIESIVRRTLNRMRKLDECPSRIGIYDYLKKNLKSVKDTRKGLNFRTGIRPFIKPDMRGEQESFRGIPVGEYAPRFVEEPQNRKIKRKSRGGTYLKERKKDRIDGSIHPALLSPSSAAKYRKLDPRSFDQPELNDPGIQLID